MVEQESEGDIKYKVVERGGKSVEKMLTNVNPTKSESCGETNCVVCSSPGGGRLCHKTRIAYEIQCNNCNAVYIGESSHNLYTRGGEHVQRYLKKKDKSFMTEHQQKRHKGEPADFSFKVTRTFRDPLSRQTYEAVAIRREAGEILNSKAEFHMPALWEVRREVTRGL